MIKYSFIKPYDIFMPRGNSHFGVTAGDFGQLRMLPMPSLFAGAFRSMLAAQNSLDLAEIENGRIPRNPELARSLGSLSEPGCFKIVFIALAKMVKDKVAMCFSMPSDLIVLSSADKKEIVKITPEPIPDGMNCHAHLPLMPVLKATPKKPAGGYWLNESGFYNYLAGKMPEIADLMHEGELWKKEIRVGVTLDGLTRSAAEGRLYSAETMSFCSDIGFVAGIE
ncbi:MAG: hypothetical protein EOM80_07505, partial [Erysipelotrichia bacterium]|nr:hypothetical protein [Erysipelotrichia bacterium]